MSRVYGATRNGPQKCEYYPVHTRSTIYRWQKPDGRVQRCDTCKGRIFSDFLTQFLASPRKNRLDYFRRFELRASEHIVFKRDVPHTKSNILGDRRLRLARQLGKTILQGLWVWCVEFLNIH